MVGIRSPVRPDDPAPPGSGVATARAARRFGLAGALLMAAGSLGAGALPVPNPLFGLRVLGLPVRNVTLSIAVTYAGMGMLVLAWLWLGRLLRHGLDHPDRLSAALVARAAALWALPLALSAPLFSTDVYSYLAQAAITERGLDPYELGPAQALGVGDPLVRTVPTIWQNTPAPYGPLFLVLGRLITPVAGDDLVLGVLAHRMLALAGVAMAVWALRRLGRRFGTDPALVLWLGVANPLVLFHLVSGVHNEALMIGLMLVGLELGLSRSWLLGTVLITCAALVKLPAALALGFLGMHLARRWGGRPRHVAKAAGLLGAWSVAVATAIGLATGLGFGWLGNLDAPNAYRSVLSVTTVLGQLGGQVGILAGLGDHTDGVLALTRALGGLVAAGVCAALLLATLLGRVDPVTGLGVGLAAVVLLAPVVHPWYVLWAVVPLATVTGLPRGRAAVVAASTVLALFVPPTGTDFAFRAYQLPMAILAGAAIVAVALLAVRGRVGPVSGPAESQRLAPAGSVSS